MPPSGVETGVVTPYALLLAYSHELMLCILFSHSICVTIWEGVVAILSLIASGCQVAKSPSRQVVEQLTDLECLFQLQDHESRFNNNHRFCHRGDLNSGSTPSRNV
jgi:hypothetical protein